MEVNVELYVKQKDRWLIDATFPGHQEGVAVEEAKEIAQQRHVQAVKVIREMVDPATGAKQEKTVFTTETEKSAEDYEPAVTSTESDEKDVSTKSWADEEIVEDKPVVSDTVTKARKARKATNYKPKSPTIDSKVGLIIKLLMIIAFSVGFAAIITLLFQRFGVSLYQRFGIGL